MVRCIAAFLDFCNLAQRAAHTMTTLRHMEEALNRFHQYRRIFVDTGVRPTGFELPRQHTLVHFVRGIRLFGSPNGVCTSLTELKHIEAVKKPWRRSNKFLPLMQIITTITRIAKVVAARVEFGQRGMLPDPAPPPAEPADNTDKEEDDGDLFEVDGQRVDSKVFLGNWQGVSQSRPFIYACAHAAVL
jgi:hypothetical protein